MNYFFFSFIFIFSSCGLLKTSTVSLKSNRVMLLQSWGYKVNPDFGLDTSFQVNKLLPTSEVSQKEWNNKYKIGLRPFGEVEWIEYLEYKDEPGKIFIVLENGPLSKIKNKPNDMVEFGKRIPDFIANAKDFDFSSTVIKALLYIKE